MRVVILVPRRDDNGWRDELWVFCRKRWDENFPDWPIYEGYPADGPFNRAQAINRAAEAAGSWDVALVIDSDTISDPNAVRSAVQRAYETGGLCIAHDKRVMLNQRGTRQVLRGLALAQWGRPQNVQVTYQDSVSCAVAVNRSTWDAVGGFDERFVGWGFEDTAFHIAVETLTGLNYHAEQSVCYHLWHPESPEASRSSPTYKTNQALRRKYESAHHQPERLLAILQGDFEPEVPLGRIPRILHRTVPAVTSSEIEGWWDGIVSLHPTWETKTWREPIDPADFPITGHLHSRCANGAQKAGLIRLELLYTYGGIYVDSDVEGVNSMDPLTRLSAFAAWEDENVIPDAVLGSAPRHPAIEECLRRACALVEAGSVDAWETGPGVTTSVLRWRDDVLVLPPGAFYPVHYREKNKLGTRNGQPWVFAEHKWHHSWDPKKTNTPNTTSVSSTRTKVQIHDDIEPVICIPWRNAGDPRRQVAYEWCVQWWLDHGLRVITGAGQSRAEMCNDAAEQAIAIGANVLVFADADTWADPQQVVDAAMTAYKAGRLTYAFDVYYRLDSGVTSAALRSGNVSSRVLVRRGRPDRAHVSGLLAVPVALWHEVGGYDERFTEWGFEDQAFNLACEVLGGEAARQHGPALHWFHRPDPTKKLAPSAEALELMTTYCMAAGRAPTHGRTGKLVRSGAIAFEASNPDPNRMREVLAEAGGPLSPQTTVS